MGPASESEAVLAKLITAGVDVFRLNFSHGSSDQHAQVALRIRAQAKLLNRQVGILADLQGPKIRIGAFAEGATQLNPGDRFVLDSNLDTEAGHATAVGLEYQALCSQVGRDDILLLDDGRIRMRVDSATDSQVVCEVVIGGKLGSRKGINRLGGGIAAAALTDKDRADIKSLSGVNPDFVAVSFVSSAADLIEAGELLHAENLKPDLIAKIERAEVVADEETLADIIRAGAGVMVARGDLGVEVGDASLIGIQKALISKARKMDRIVITATQMMESMINSSMPTRAEVFDVANAVLDGTDAVMLSAETAVGDYPIEVVTAMAETCLGAEQHPSTRTSRYRVDRQFGSAQESIAMAAIYAANHNPAVRGIACLTESGTTPLLMSRLSSGRPIFALSSEQGILQRMTLCRGVIPLYFDADAFSLGDIETSAIEFLASQGYLHSGDAIIMTRGSIIGERGNTNIMKVLSVP